MKYQLNIRSNQGYSADQVSTVTVAALKELLDYYEDEDEIVTFDLNNPRGACYGTIDVFDLEPIDEEEE